MYSETRKWAQKIIADNNLNISLEPEPVRLPTIIEIIEPRKIVLTQAEIRKLSMDYTLEGMLGA